MVDKDAFLEQYGEIDKDVMLDIFDTFFTECPQRIDEIRNSIDSADFNQLEFSAHKLKGAVGVFSTSDPFETSQELVTLAREKKYDDLQEIFNKLEKSIQVLLVDLKKLRKNFE